MTQGRMTQDQDCLIYLQREARRAAEGEGDDPGEDPRPVCLIYLQREERRTAEGESDEPGEGDPRPV